MYNKLFSKIVNSSIWLMPDATRLVWMTLIALMDEDGFVTMACVENLAHTSRVALPLVQLAVEQLEVPDPRSSDPEFEGRRIERVPGGWYILNARKYRELATSEMIRAGNRLRQQRLRDKRKSNGIVTGNNVSITSSEAVSEAVSIAAAAVSVNRARPPSPPDPQATTTASDLAFAIPTPEAQTPRRLNLGDLEARHLALLVGREDKDKARTLVDLYGWDSCSEALTDLEPIAKARTPGKQRIMVSELGKFLRDNFNLEAADYKRAGLPIPEGITHGEA